MPSNFRSIYEKPESAAPSGLSHNRHTMSEEEQARTTTARQPRHAALGLSPEKLKVMYRQMVLARALDRRMWVLNRQGKAPFVISGQGHEAAQGGPAAPPPPRGGWLGADLPGPGVFLPVGGGAPRIMLVVYAPAAG